LTHSVLKDEEVLEKKLSHLLFRSSRLPSCCNQILCFERIHPVSVLFKNTLSAHQSASWGHSVPDTSIFTALPLFIAGKTLKQRLYVLSGA